MTSPIIKTSDRRICLGKITSPHGIKGLVKVFAFGEDPRLIETLDQIYTSETSNQTISITLKNTLGKHILAQAKDCDTREKAEELQGTELWASRGALPEINNDDEFYVDDLAGLAVFNSKKENIGTVTAVQNYGAGDLLEIKPHSGESYLVPFQDEYVTDINLDEKCVTVENAQNFIIE